MGYKTKLGIVFGGMSSENKVSIISANSILHYLNKEKYIVYPIYIDSKGDWWKINYDLKKDIYYQLENKKSIENITQYIKKLDIIFPVLHGLYGEDGTIQGMLEMSKIPYVGCGVLASSIGMDKVYSKIVFEKTI